MSTPMTYPGGDPMRAAVCHRFGGPEVVHIHPVVTTPGPYRAEDLAYLVELADTGHDQPITQTTAELDDIAAGHRLAGTGRKRGNVVVRIPPPTPKGHRS